MKGNLWIFITMMVIIATALVVWALFSNSRDAELIVNEPASMDFDITYEPSPSDEVPLREDTNEDSSKLEQYSYTSQDVSAHDNPDDCWTIIGEGVYDVTDWIIRHPGGAENIVALCGIDGSVLFQNQHADDKRPAQVLTSWYIGRYQP